MTPCIALLRGINVGRAKRMAMAELRVLVEGLGFSGVRTILNSGNVVFLAPRPSVRKAASAIASAIQGRFGFTAPVVVLTARELGAIVAENPLLETSGEPSKLLVAFVAAASALAGARTLLAQSWAPEALAVSDRAAYLWCARGIIESRLMQAFARVTGEAATTRNWATVLRLQAASGAGKNVAHR